MTTIINLESNFCKLNNWNDEDDNDDHENNKRKHNFVFVRRHLFCTLRAPPAPLVRPNESKKESPWRILYILFARPLHYFYDRSSADITIRYEVRWDSTWRCHPGNNHHLSQPKWAASSCAGADAKAPPGCFLSWPVVDAFIPHWLLTRLEACSSLKGCSYLTLKRPMT